MKHGQFLTPATLCAKVSSDRPDVDLPVSAHSRGLELVAEAPSGLISACPNSNGSEGCHAGVLTRIRLPDFG